MAQVKNKRLCRRRQIPKFRQAIRHQDSRLLVFYFEVQVADQHPGKNASCKHPPDEIRGLLRIVWNPYASPSAGFFQQPDSKRRIHPGVIPCHLPELRIGFLGGNKRMSYKEIQVVVFLAAHGLRKKQNDAAPRQSAGFFGCRSADHGHDYNL